MNHRLAPPIIAVVLLLLPVLYVGSYLALVVPGPWVLLGGDAVAIYRFGGRTSEIGFWPLEQIDRKVRPRAWEATHEWQENPYWPNSK
ncbi:hypothetical protein NA78x_003782 [Anatilimnocola sp. NA78]|uniref:hypothetical protein n=1 Tax=Anatilimnocola sp. NA78 TaxID=3415683 RepID=UPI003CE536E0